MNLPAFTSGASLYAIKLLATDPTDCHRLVGRLEHVLSGRCQEFHSGAALLAALAREQSRGFAVDAVPSNAVQA